MITFKSFTVFAGNLLMSLLIGCVTFIAVVDLLGRHGIKPFSSGVVGFAVGLFTAWCVLIAIDRAFND